MINEVEVNINYVLINSKCIVISSKISSFNYSDSVIVYVQYFCHKSSKEKRKSYAILRQKVIMLNITFIHKINLVTSSFHSCLRVLI